MVDADNDWPAALYEPRRTCPLCHEPLICIGYVDAVPGFRTWRYELPCGCYRGLASNDVLPAAKKPRAKRVVMVHREGPAFAPPLAIAAHSVTTQRESAAYFRASARRSERERRVEAWYAAGGAKRVIASGPKLALPGPRVDIQVVQVDKVDKPLPAELLTPPYPYFGGKSKIAAEIWKRIGDVPNFVDPFFGGGSILLKRPTEHPFRARIETVNDKDGMISNFWRALQCEPEAVARWADWPVNENDLHARHSWLVKQKDGLAARLEGDPDYFDTRIAGYWVWGMALWIGSGFCSGNGSWVSVDGKLVKSDELGGVRRKVFRLMGEQGIKAARVDAGAGLRQHPHLGDSGQGVVRKTLHLGDAGRRVQRKRVSLGSLGRGALSRGVYDYFDVLSERLKRVRVCSGDWTRVLGNSPTTKLGITGIVLDPPYTHDGRDATLYNHESASIADEVRRWAVEHGANSLLRIAYCGYEDDYKWPDGWTAMKWTPRGGFDGQRKNGKNGNRQREIVMFSPACLKVQGYAVQAPLFAATLP